MVGYPTETRFKKGKVASTLAKKITRLANMQRKLKTSYYLLVAFTYFARMTTNSNTN